MTLFKREEYFSRIYLVIRQIRLQETHRRSTFANRLLLVSTYIFRFVFNFINDLTNSILLGWQLSFISTQYSK